MPSDRVSLPMRGQLYLAASNISGFVPDTMAIERSMLALERRGGMRRVEQNGSAGWVPTAEGLAFITEAWPACPLVLKTYVEPEGGWTPREGMRP